MSVDEGAPALPRITAIIVNYRTPRLALEALDSLARERELVPSLRAIVVDNASGDDSAVTLERELQLRGDWVQFLPQQINGGFGWGNNAALRVALQSDQAPDAFYLLNPDAKIEPGAVRALAMVLQQESCTGAVGSQLLSETGHSEPSAFSFPSLRGELSRGARTGLVEKLLRVPPISLPPSHARVDVDWVTGASVLIRAEALREAGLFDDGFFLYFEEVELMWRLRQHGWRIRHEPASRVTHVGGAATGHDLGVIDRPLPAYWYQSRRRFFARTRGVTGARATLGAWLIGELTSRLRSGLGLGRIHRVNCEWRDQLRLGWATRRDGEPAYIDWRRPHSLPFWMELEH